MAEPELPQATIDDMQGLIDSLDLDGWQAQLDDALGAGSFRLKDMFSQIASGEMPLTLESIFDQMLQWVQKGVGAKRGLMIQLIALIVVSALCERAIEPLGTQGAARVAGIVVYAAAALVIINVLQDALAMLSGALRAVHGIMQAVFPALSVLLTLCGGHTTAAVLQPVYVFALQVTGYVITNVLMPLVMMAGAVSIAGNMFKRGEMDELANSVRSGSIWCVGIMMTVLAAFSGIQGMFTSAYDGVTARAAKYAIDNTVPYVGGMLADMSDGLLSGALIIKNAMGVSSLLSVLLVAGAPIMQVLVSYFLLRVTSAVAALFQSRISGILKAAASTMVTMIALVSIGMAMLLLLMATSVKVGAEIMALR